MRHSRERIGNVIQSKPRNLGRGDVKNLLRVNEGVEYPHEGVQNHYVERELPTRAKAALVVGGSFKHGGTRARLTTPPMSLLSVLD